VIEATWVGHATVLLELDGVRLLTDPLLRRHVGPLVSTAAPLAEERVDAVLLSHLHADHAELPSLRRLSRTATVIAPRGSGRWLAAHGVRNLHELSVGEEVVVGPVRVAATPAEHDGHRWPVGGPEAEPIGYVVRGSSTVYFAGDTDLFEGMRSLSADLALLPVAGWGPTLGPGHLDPGRAAEAAARIAPRVAVPIHWGTLALPWRSGSGGPPRQFADRVAHRTPGVEVRVLAPGERTALA
jgi:L-ascorbate metabolism protein UlaG (beta-lactamase superfamily)